MMKKTIRISLALLLCALLALSSGCTFTALGGLTERSDGLTDAYTDDILPQSKGSAYGETVGATLYFRYLSEDMLAGMEQDFTLTAENTLEQLVIQALIDGPQDDLYQYSALVHPDTRLVSLKDQGGTLSVTLSEEFLNEMQNMDIDDDAERRRLAVLSIVDSVTAIGNYSRVLLLIDHYGTGNGERLTYNEAGWDEYGDRTIEPMQRDTSVLLSPENVLDISLRAIVEKDYDRLESFLADRDYDGTVCPTSAEVAEKLGAKASIVSFARNGDVSVSGDGKRAVALVNITYVDSAGHPTEITALPVRLLLEDVWKVSFNSMDAMFPEY